MEWITGFIRSIGILVNGDRRIQKLEDKLNGMPTFEYCKFNLKTIEDRFEDGKNRMNELKKDSEHIMDRVDKLFDHLIKKKG